MATGTVILYGSLAGVEMPAFPFIYDKYRNVVNIRIGTAYLMGIVLSWGAQYLGQGLFWVMVSVGYFYVTVTNVI